MKTIKRLFRGSEDKSERAGIAHGRTGLLIQGTAVDIVPEPTLDYIVRAEVSEVTENGCVLTLLPGETGEFSRGQRVSCLYYPPGMCYDMYAEVENTSNNGGTRLTLRILSSGGIESRRHTRVDVDMPCELTVGAGTAPEQAAIENISESGALIDSAKPMEKGDRVRVRLRLFPDAPSLNLTAEVVHVTENAKHGAAGYGVRFVDMVSEEKDTLSKFVKSR